VAGEEGGAAALAAMPLLMLELLVIAVAPPRLRVNLSPPWQASRHSKQLHGALDTAKPQIIAISSGRTKWKIEISKNDFKDGFDKKL